MGRRVLPAGPHADVTIKRRYGPGSTVTSAQRRYLKKISAIADHMDIMISILLKIDTGMSRLDDPKSFPVTAIHYSVTPLCHNSVTILICMFDLCTQTCSGQNMYYTVGAGYSLSLEENCVQLVQQPKPPWSRISLL